MPTFALVLMLIINTTQFAIGFHRSACAKPDSTEMALGMVQVALSAATVIAFVLALTWWETPHA